MISASEAKNRLIEGNRLYLDAASSGADISPAKRKETAENGQYPYAIVVTCSDSRVIPESIFSAGIGELFVIRVAGNVLDDHQLGSIEYAADHLGTKLIVLLGHTKCGAVGAAIEGIPAVSSSRYSRTYSWRSATRRTISRRAASMSSTGSRR